MKYAEIRQAFIDYFQENQHQPVDSSSLIPHNDPTLMFTNAGMNQFKDVFLGTDKRAYNRAVTIQKCLRAGGKHNDLENVGFTARHHTFFEMMGNFSFGDYFKEGAIAMAWEFLTKKLGIPEDRLYVSVFTTDDEAAEIWEKKIGVPKEKIFRFGEKDNFWRMGKTGPCGPCSEIFYDHNPSGPKISIDQDEDRFVEIWNLVFMQFFEDENGKQTPLPKPSVDTGSGIERVTAAMQGVKDNYQSDVFKPIIQKICDEAKISSDWSSSSQNPKTLGAVKVVADHARAACFLMSEGVLPGNEGKGYVLRRIMRRAIRYARSLSETQSLYYPACEEVIEMMGSFYPELTKKAEFILKAVKDEEKRFLQTLDKGNEILEAEILELKKKNKLIIDGKTAFTLYDTYGFPFDLTQVVAREQDLEVDEEGFKRSMEAAKDLARAAHKSHNISTNEKHLGEWTQPLPNTDFKGYQPKNLAHFSAKVVGLSDGEKNLNELNSQGFIAFDATPFYAEGGGQVGDVGLIQSETGKLVATIQDCKKMNEVFMHQAFDIHETLKVGETYQLSVTSERRQSTANNHSATHLMNSALKKVLGDHVNQAGSLVNESKLRFDFNHGQPVSSDEIAKIEELVNEQIKAAQPVTDQEMGQEEAIAAGATAMFGEKYGDKVRVISMGEKQGDTVFSMELCGGTHVQNTSEIKHFKVVSETGVAAGTRRIEALTGERAEQYLNELAVENESLIDILDKELLQKDEKLKNELKRLQVLFPLSLSGLVFLLQNQIKNIEGQLKGRGEGKLEIPPKEKLEVITAVPDLANENLRLCEILAAQKPKIDAKTFSGGLTERLTNMLEKYKNLQESLEKRSRQTVSVDDILKEAKEKDFDGEKGLALITQVEISDRNHLSEVVDKIRDKKSHIAIALIGEGESDKPKPMIVAVSKSLKKLHAGKITKELCSILDGKGGGRPDFAQGSVSNLANLNSAKDKFYELLDQ